MYLFVKRRIIKQTILNLVFVRVWRRKIWIGQPGCGFYIHPDILLPGIGSTGLKKSICYSAGVGDNISFDLELIKNFEFSDILLFDPTPMTIDWIARQDLPTIFQFHPIGISGESGTKEFYLADTDVASSAASSSMIADGNKWVSKNRAVRVQVMSLGDIAKANGHTFVDVLKMDIEGSEFEVIGNFKKLDELRFGQICIEFHQRFFPDRWRVLRKAIKQLSDAGYKCFSVNWNMMEFSFINVALVSRSTKS